MFAGARRATLAEALERRQASSGAPIAGLSLYDFVPRVTPAFTAPTHLAPLVDLLDRVEREPVRACVSVPPRHSKTETVMHGVARFLARHPERTVAYVSYAADISRSKSRQLRDYAGRAGVTLREDSSALHEWRTPQGGGLLATGIGGPLTGHGVSCFPAGTLIATERGPQKIEDVVRSHNRPRVLSFDHDSGRAEWNRVLAVREIESDDLVEFTTAAGRVVRCTHDHPVFVRGVGYREASLLSPGDRLIVAAVAQSEDVRVVQAAEGRPGAVLPRVLRQSEGHASHGYVRVVQSGLPSRVVRGGEEQASRVDRPVLLESVSLLAPSDQGSRPVRALREAEEARRSLLLGSLQGGCESAEGGEADGSLPTVCFAVCPPHNARGVLHSRVRERGSLGANGRSGQLALQDGEELREVVRGDAALDHGARRGEVCHLRQSRDCAAGEAQGHRCAADQHDRASHQRECARQRAGESGDVVQHLPCGAPQVSDDTVAVVRRLRGESHAVYDLQVERVSNFFAGEVLVHNCLVIDDPFKNRQDADSPTVRENVAQWFTSTAMTRVEPGGSVLVVHTRWHRDDLIGRLERDEDVAWEVVNLPALDAHEQALWPERWSRAALLSRRAEVGEHDWQSLYQGHPVARKGRIYEAFTRATHVVPHATLERDYRGQGRWLFRRIVVGVDWGFTHPGAMVVVGQTGAGALVVLHVEHHPGLLVAERTDATREGWLSIARRLRDTYRPERFVADPSEPGNIRQLRQALGGTPVVENADNDVAEGLRRTKVAMQPRAGGGVGLVVSDRCVALIDEIEGYSYRAGADGLSETPQEVRDDACDALRYAVMAVTR